MAGNVSSSSVFADNFMKGFSFVDDIKRNNKRDKLLAEELKAQKKERAFQRRRLNLSDQRQDKLFQQQQDDRADRLSDEEAAEKGDEFVLQNPDASAEELSLHPKSPMAVARLKELAKLNRETDALETSRTIGRAGFEGAGLTKQPSNSVTQGAAATAEQGAASQLAPGQAGVNTGDLPNMTAEERAAHDELLAGPQAGFAPSRGQESVKQVSEEDITRRSTEFQEKGFAGRVGATVAGQAAQTVAFAEQVAERADPLAARGGEGQSNAAAAFGGRNWVPVEFAGQEGLEGVNDPRERAAIQARDEQITAELAEQGRKPRNNVLLPPASLQGAHLAGGQALRDAAIHQENQVVAKYDEFLDGNSKFEEVALQQPGVAAADYLANRNTYKDKKGEDATKELDDRMVPYMDMYADELSAELSTMQPGSSEYRQRQQTMDTMIASRDQIARQQPPVDKQAGLHSGGLKIGDTQRANDTLDVIYDPNLPMVQQHDPSAINAAATVAGRISPSTKRLNRKQIQSLQILAQSGYISKPVMMAVVQTGQWPAGKNPNAIKSINGKFGLTNDGRVVLLADANKKKGADIDRSLGDDQIKWALMGAKTAKMSETRNDQMTGFMIDNAGWIRKHFNTENQESMMAAGRVLGQSVFLANKQQTEFETDYNAFTNPKDAYTMEQVFYSSKIREEMAQEYNVRLVPMPAVGNRSDFDTEPFKRGIAEGVHGEGLRSALPHMSEDDILYAYWVINAEPEDIAAANAQGQ